MCEIRIERARLSDAEGLCRLNREEMGYDYPLEQTRGQLARLLKDPAHAVFAARAGGELAGYCHARSYELLYFPPLKDILGIAVSARFQRMGIGRRLLEAAEEWARAEGCAGVRLVSGASREGAHAFYRSCGYDGGKTQLNFKKMWG